MRNDDVALHEQLQDRAAQLREVASGLLEDKQKTLPCKWFYDEYGSQLFDRICDLDAYYPTRTEHQILRRSAKEMAAYCGEECAIIEYGAGSVVKVRFLIDALENPVAVIPIDISGEHVAAAAKSLANDYPDLEVVPVCADYTQPVELPATEKPSRRRVAFFPGSTIGNFHRRDAVKFLSRIAKTVGEGGALLIGVDRKKDPEVLERAYNDPEGITAEFNRNLLRHLNRELGTDFAIDRFEHRAVYSEEAGRIEMHLESLDDQEVQIGDHSIDLNEGETIRTECSYKYAPSEFRELAREAGFESRAEWTDPSELFGVYFLEVAGE